MREMLPHSEARMRNGRGMTDMILKSQAFAGATSSGEGSKQHGLVGRLVMRLDVKTMRSRW
jgi:hypothetical protein